MCGRYTLTASADLLRRHFGLAGVPAGLAPRYNIAPGQSVAVVPNLPERRAEMFRWGLIPSWAKDASIGNRMINARAETLAEKPSFRNALRRRRCLVLADGFYEWSGTAKPKVPMYVRLKSGAPFAFAGLWEVWQPPEGDPVHSCTIVTTTSNRLMARIHDRMPAMLGERDVAAWLDPEPREGKDLMPLLGPFPDELMEAYAVSRLVNAPANDRPECIQPSERGT